MCWHAAQTYVTSGFICVLFSLSRHLVPRDCCRHSKRHAYSCKSQSCRPFPDRYFILGKFMYFSLSLYSRSRRPRTILVTRPAQDTLNQKSVFWETWCPRNISKTPNVAVWLREQRIAISCLTHLWTGIGSLNKTKDSVCFVDLLLLMLRKFHWCRCSRVHREPSPCLKCLRSLLSCSVCFHVVGRFWIILSQMEYLTFVWNEIVAVS